ncbi:MAG TPA: hypothetical protein VFW15_01260, partial [Thermoanaerobaculia bacterium]|nr:hypothetical protein [Thermoanaerobaculia bacterium]
RTGHDSEGHPFSLFFLGFWLVFVSFPLFALLWMLLGREVLRVGAETFALRREILGVGRSREFSARDVRNVRYSVASFNPWDPNTALLFWGLGGGPIAFDYGSRTYRFGAGVDEAEARDLMAQIENRLWGHGG